MATLNKCMFIGRVTHDIEPPRAMPNGGFVVKFRMGIGRGKKNQATGQWEKAKDQLWLDCECFSHPDGKRNLVQVIEQYVRKGSELYVEGRMRTDEWVDKTSGQNRSRNIMVVDSIELLGKALDEKSPPKEATKAVAGANDGWPGVPAGGDEDDSIPF